MGLATPTQEADASVAPTDVKAEVASEAEAQPRRRPPDVGHDGSTAAGLRALVRFWSLTRGDRRWLVLVSVSLVVTALAETVAVLLFGDLTDSALQTGSLRAYWGPAGFWLAVSLLAALVGFGGNCLGAWVGERFILRLRARVFTHLQRLPVDFFRRHRPGDLVERLTGDVAAVEELAVTGAIGIASSVVSAVLFGAALVWLRWDMAVAVIAAAPVFWLAARAMTGRVEAAARAQRAADGAVSAVIEESLRGGTLRRMFGRRGEEEQRLDVEAGGWLRATMAAVRLEEGYHQLVAALESLCVLGVIGLGTWEVGRHRMTVGQLLSFAAFLGCLYPPLQSLGRTALLVSSATAAADRVAEIWDAPVASSAGSAEPAVSSTERPDAALEFRGVSVRFPGAEHDTLRRVSLAVRPGRTVVVSGPSGSGKSTLVRLALRLAEPVDGEVLLNGLGPDRLSTERLRDELTLVPQHTDLLPASVADNIGVARPDLTRERITAAAREAGLHDAVTRLPQGYDTVLDPFQPQLSGGELRRLALARAYLRDSSLWILDEPTAGLDAQSAAVVVASLRRHTADRSVLIVTQDPSPYAWADARAALEDGCLEGGCLDEDCLDEQCLAQE